MPSTTTELTEGTAFSYLHLTKQERRYCLLFAKGLDHDEICAEIGELPGTVDKWKQRHAKFMMALQEIYNNPNWVIPNVVLPQQLIQLVENDDKYLRQLEGAAPYKGVSSQRVEQWLTMAGLYGEQKKEPQGAYARIQQNLTVLINPALVPNRPDENSLMTAGPTRALPEAEPWFIEGELVDGEKDS